jgi:hypothetical protein
MFLAGSDATDIFARKAADVPPEDETEFGRVHPELATSGLDLCSFAGFACAERGLLSTRTVPWRS